MSRSVDEFSSHNLWLTLVWQLSIFSVFLWLAIFSQLSPANSHSVCIDQVQFQMSESSTTTFDRTITASARAISKVPDLSVEADETATAVRLGMRTPDKHTSDKDIVISRGIADAIAVVAAHHNEDVHSQYKPVSLHASILFNEMERIRCEAVGAGNQLGLSGNLKKLWESTYDGAISETEELTLAFSWLTKTALRQPVSLTEPMQLAISRWQNSLTTGTDYLWSRLSDHRHNQSAYAEIALEIIALINEDTSNSYSSKPLRPEKYTPEKPDEEELRVKETTDDDTETELSSESREEEQEEQITLSTETSETEFEEDLTKNRDAPLETESETGNLVNPEQTKSPYCSYSYSFDEIIKAGSLCDKKELQTLRELLDAHIDRHSKIVGKLAGQLQRILMAQQRRHWKFDLDEGTLDTSNLTRIVTQPFSGLSFKTESDTEFKDTVVTLLVDNSKSMLGKPIAIAASCADVLAQTLERCGVTVEILGFTTTELHGGALFNLWKREGKTQNPGRLNGLRHIIYKSADVPYRRARAEFGLMLQNELLKQNIDGEALLWAHKRIQNRPEERKLLLVISDGAPVDTSTMSANIDNYLIDHLHEVIKGIEKNKSVELAAIGIGHDVSNYYQRAITISDAKDLGKTLLTQFKSLFGETRSR